MLPSDFTQFRGKSSAGIDLLPFPSSFISYQVIYCACADKTDIQKERRRAPKGRGWCPHLDTCEFHEAPRESQEDYPYVTVGFIKPNYSVWNGLATFFSFNNETTNVLTQFVGLVVFYWCFYCIKVASEQALLEGMRHTTSSSKTSLSLRRFWLETVFLADCLCCTFSLLYHLYRVMNLKWYLIFNFLDWGGCTLVAILSSLAVDMTELSIDTLPSWISPEAHGLLTTVGFIGVICLWMSGRTNHATRFISFNVVVFGAAGPCIAAVFIDSGRFAFVSICSFLIAGIFFGSHFQERRFPRIFDLFLSSHTMWHVFYIIGLLLCHIGLCNSLFGRWDMLFFPQ